jgi:NAD(P)-dependent dehydrogenase (short-subunit alcohol dehydrogenase family)
MLNGAVTPFGSLGHPEQIADAVVLLRSEAADWIAGQTLGVDGGQLTTMAVLRRVQGPVEMQSKQKAA